MFNLLRTSVVFRSAFIVLGMAFFVGVVFAVLSFYFLALAEQKQSNNRIEEILATVENTASIACYLTDKNLASELARGLLKNNDISHAKILTGQTILAEEIRPDSRGSASRIVTQTAIERDIYSPFNPQEKVCRIVLEPNWPFIKEQSEAKARFVVYLLVAQAVLMACAVVYVVFSIIIRPIKTISDRLHCLSAETGEQIALPRGNENDEIGQLVRDVNTLVSSLIRILEEERSLRVRHEVGEKKFKTIFDNAETGIFQIKVSGEVLSHNQAFLRMLALGRQNIDVTNSLTGLLEGQELRLHLMIDNAVEKSTVVSEDFCIEVGDPPVRKWFNLVISPAEDGILQGLVNDITDRKLNEERANRIAETDHLTGTYNRLGFEKELNRLSNAANKGSGSCFYLFMIDLDKFKQVNDLYGHEVGDKVLCHFANILTETLRKTDFVARLGGDEFVVLLKDMSIQEKAENIAGKILELVNEPIPVSEDISVEIGASIGISYSDGTPFNKEALMREADTAMYAVKQGGRNGYRVY